jgi:hypothetical protein
LEMAMAVMEFPRPFSVLDWSTACSSTSSVEVGWKVWNGCIYNLPQIWLYMIWMVICPIADAGTLATILPAWLLVFDPSQRLPNFHPLSFLNIPSPSTIYFSSLLTLLTLVSSWSLKNEHDATPQPKPTHLLTSP